MGSIKHGGDGVSSAGYWGQLKAWGIAPAKRLSEQSWLCLDRHDQTVHIDDPEWMTCAERVAALAAIAARYLDLD